MGGCFSVKKSDPLDITCQEDIVNVSSGKHMICDIKNIKNRKLIHSLPLLYELLDQICEKYNFMVLQKIHHVFEPQGITIVYLLSESHISIHTFPENEYIALDIYTCRQYKNNDIYQEIFDYIIVALMADTSISPVILDREF